MALDYKLTDPQDRLAVVNKVLQTQPINRKYLTYLADYLLFTNDKFQTKKERNHDKPILTKNREKTISKRQTSLDEIVSNLENGEDGLYLMINQDKNQLLDPREHLSKKDIKENPELTQLFSTIDSLKVQFDNATGIRKYQLKTAIIETWQQIYILKASTQNNVVKGRANNYLKNMCHMKLPENITINDNLLPESDGLISLFNPAHISFLLCYYAQLKEECWEDLNSDMRWLLVDLENITEQALKEKEEFLYTLLIYKIDGYTNKEIREILLSEYGIDHTEQYYSTLWRKRIPKLIATQAQKNWIEWHYFNNEKAEWIKCGKCGQYKLAHPLFFSSNSNAKGYYSICKSCRNKK